LDSVRVVNQKKVAEVETGAGKSDYYQPLLIAEVVEYSRVGDIERKMRTAMNKSQLYLGLFGKEYSQRTVKELDDALNRGMTILLYYFTSPPVALTSKPKTDKVYQLFNEKIIPKGILIRGNYRTVEMKTDEELLDEIYVDILAELTEMIRQYHAVQKAVSGFES